jgi:hypothetical protein
MACAASRRPVAAQSGGAAETVGLRNPGAGGTPAVLFLTAVRSQDEGAGTTVSEKKN